LDLSHLTTFCTVIEAGSISKAAKELYVTQPAISLKIQELEDHYQVQLLERTNRGIKPTEIGLYVYSESQKIIALLANMQREIDAMHNPSEELVIGASNTVGNFALPCTMFVFRERHPGYKVNIELGNTAEVINKMISRRVEIGLVEGPINESWAEQLAREDINIKIIARNKLILVAKNMGQYSSKRTITFEEMKNIPLIIREQGSGIRAAFEEVLSNKGFTLDDFNIVYELNSINSIVSAVASDMGVALLPGVALRKELRYKILKAIRISDIKFQHNLSLLYQSNTKKHSYNAFIQLINSKDRGFC